MKHGFMALVIGTSSLASAAQAVEVKGDEPSIDKSAQTITWPVKISSKNPDGKLIESTIAFETLNCRFGSVVSQGIGPNSGLAKLDLHQSNGNDGGRLKFSRELCRQYGFEVKF